MQSMRFRIHRGVEATGILFIVIMKCQAVVIPARTSMYLLLSLCVVVLVFPLEQIALFFDLSYTWRRWSLCESKARLCITIAFSYGFVFATLFDEMNIVTKRLKIDTITKFL